MNKIFKVKSRPTSFFIYFFINPPSFTLGFQKNHLDSKKKLLSIASSVILSFKKPSNLLLRPRRIWWKINVGICLFKCHSTFINFPINLTKSDRFSWNSSQFLVFCVKPLEARMFFMSANFLCVQMSLSFGVFYFNLFILCIQQYRINNRTN